MGYLGVEKEVGAKKKRKVFSFFSCTVKKSFVLLQPVSEGKSEERVRRGRKRRGETISNKRPVRVKFIKFFEK
jgi:hypothetical protein